MINIGIVGVGYWGPNYARLCFEIDGVNLIWITDLNQEALKKIKQRYPGVKTTADYKELLKDKGLSAVIIVTPAQTHYKIAKDFLLAGKHVLLEKPLTAKLSEAIKLKKIVDKTRKVLIVDHLFKFNSAVQKLKELISTGELGKINYISASYTALGPIRKDVDALWDLAPHWIYTINYLLDSTPVSAIGRGGNFLKKGMNDVVFINLKYPNEVLVNIHISWLYPQKVRNIAVVGEKKMVVLDDVSTDAKLVIHNKSIKYSSDDPNFANLQLIINDGEILIPKLENKEPLKEVFKHFIKCIEEKAPPFVGVEEGVAVVKILEKINQSLNKKDQAMFSKK